MQAGEYLTFRIDALEYGIDLACVREVRGRDWMGPIALGAGARSTLCGTLELRGVAVPVVALRPLIDCGAFDPACSAAIILLGRSAPVAGIAVDSVCDVLALLPGELRPLDEAAIARDAPWVLGAGMRDARNILVIDLECVLARAGIALV